MSQSIRKSIKSLAVLFQRLQDKSNKDWRSIVTFKKKKPRDEDIWGKMEEWKTLMVRWVWNLVLSSTHSANSYCGQMACEAQTNLLHSHSQPPCLWKHLILTSGHVCRMLSDRLTERGGQPGRGSPQNNIMRKGASQWSSHNALSFAHWSAQMWVGTFIAYITVPGCPCHQVFPESTGWSL